MALMLTRGTEKELADYYDQAVVGGQILVAVETEVPSRQRQADAIFNQQSRPTSMPKED
jgi:hypothetical protein